MQGRLVCRYGRVEGADAGEAAMWLRKVLQVRPRKGGSHLAMLTESMMVVVIELACVMLVSEDVIRKWRRRKAERRKNAAPRRIP